jgi:hypothetical protein
MILLLAARGVPVESATASAPAVGSVFAAVSVSVSSCCVFCCACIPAIADIHSVVDITSAILVFPFRSSPGRDDL